MRRFLLPLPQPPTLRYGATPFRQRRGICAINKHQPPRPPTLRYGATPLHMRGELNVFNRLYCQSNYDKM
ncbi:MAG: hypothetical protein LBB23_00215 [Rickettsiales bacterium]|nr:hypothetical protein [Rickettsiales bacterium]